MLPTGDKIGSDVTVGRRCLYTVNRKKEIIVDICLQKRSKYGNSLIEDCSESIVETLSIQEVARSAIWMKADNIIIESDSYVTIFSISGKIVARKQIPIIGDIKCIVRNIKNIFFFFFLNCNRLVNILLDRMARKAPVTRFNGF